MPGPRPSGLLVALRNVLNVLFLLIAVPLTVGIYAQAYIEAGQRARFPPPGQLVDIGGGEKIHLRTWGETNSRPTILLFVSGYSISSAWAWIARGLEADYRLVAFDRPGMGWSTGGVGPRDAEHAAQALSAALRITGIGPPYIVVGHSYGGFSARVFTAEHRAEVVALILLDSSHPDAPGSGYGFLARLNALRWHAGLGILDSLLLPPDPGYGPLPVGEGEPANAVTHWTTHLDGVADELENWTASANEVRAAGTFDDLPLLVVAAAETDDQRRYELDLQNLSTKSEFVALNVGHSDMLVQADQAQLVVDQIRGFVARAVP